MAGYRSAVPGHVTYRPVSGTMDLHDDWGRTTMLGWVRTRRPRGDDGQMAAPFIIFTALLVLSFFVVALVPVGASTNERSRSQIAADAAALAGAEEARTLFAFTSTVPGPQLPFLLGGVPAVLVEPITGATGDRSARSYAQQNKATVTLYNLDTVRGRTHAEVRHNSAAYPEHGYSVAEAEAEMDINFFGCRWVGVPPGAYYPYGDFSFTADLICGAWSATYTVLNTLGYPTASYDTTPDAIYDDLEPRLVK